ncbi:MAG: glycosyltransferase family 39 protein [Chitinophagaceae bacterium]|nr:glycosyltransferase family 39 protein [Chitinophagaceae bacterium]
MKLLSSPIYFILLLALIKFLLPFFLQHPVYELHRDEFLYLEQGQHLAWGYMEVPPMISCLAWLTHLLGNSFFWVKFWPCLFGAFTLIITCKMVEEMGGKLFAIFIAGLCIMFTAYLRLHFLFQANFLEVFWWSLSALFIVKYNNSKNIRWLYWIGFAFGCAWLSKNSALFFILGFIASLVLTTNRKLLFNKHLYGAGFVAFLIALPNLLWQYNHNWPLLHHMEELRETQLRFLNPVDFLMGQLLMYFTAFFIWIMGLIWLFTAKGKQYRMLAWVYITVIVLLLVSSGKNYYSMGAYPMLFAAGAVGLEQWTMTRFRWIGWTAAAIILFLAWVVLPVAMPLWEPDKLAAFYKEKGIDKTGALRWEDQKDHSLPQDFADYLGWKEITEKAEKMYQSLPQKEKDSTVVYCRHYGLAGALKYYGKDEQFKAKVISDNGSFLHWIPNEFGFKHLIFVGRRMPDKDDEVFQHFEKVTLIDSVTYKHSRQLGDKVIFFENADSVASKLAADGLKQMKQEFSRKKW